MLLHQFDQLDNQYLKVYQDDNLIYTLDVNFTEGSSQINKFILFCLGDYQVVLSDELNSEQISWGIFEVNNSVYNLLLSSNDDFKSGNFTVVNYPPEPIPPIEVENAVITNLRVSNIIFDNYNYKLNVEVNNVNPNLIQLTYGGSGISGVLSTDQPSTKSLAKKTHFKRKFMEWTII